AGWINRRFGRVREAYTRTLTATLAHRPVVLTLWAIVLALIVPFYMFSQHELAPTEVQGVVFGVVQAAPHGTPDPTTPANRARRRKVDPRVQAHVPANVPEPRLRGHGDEAVGRAEAHPAAAPDGGGRRVLPDPGPARHLAGAAAASRRGELPGGPGHRLDRR